MSYPTKFLIEGLDRLGKDTLISGILNRAGYHKVLHYSKPLVLDQYMLDGQCLDAAKRDALYQYQRASFSNMFEIIRSGASIICNRAHLGECVYAPLYRGYSGQYVFDLEQRYGMQLNQSTRLILLTENFKISKHFVDDGLSLGAVDNRQREQNMFITAFSASSIPDRREICVTDPVTGKFKPAAQIVREALAN